MFLLILESIGMTELIFIGIVALIVFGPRKLPQMARTIGKTMAEFRKVTGEFKDTWQKEVDFDEFRDDDQRKSILPTDNTMAKIGEVKSEEFEVPEIREINQEEFKRNFKPNETETITKKQGIKALTGKQDWL